MIAEMDQVLVVGRRSEAKEVLSTLQSLGLMQVTSLDAEVDESPIQPLRLSGADLEAKETWSRLVSRSTALLDQLGVNQRQVARTEAGADAQALEHDLAQLSEKVERLIAERSELRDELELSVNYLPLLRHLAPLLGPLDDSRYLAGTAFLLDADELPKLEAQLAEQFASRFVLAQRPHLRELLVVAVTLRKELPQFQAALARSGIAELSLPERYREYGVAKAAHVMDERTRTQPQRVSAIEAELDKLAQQHGARLVAINRVASDQQDRYARLEDMAAGRYSFALQGWVPSSARPSLVKELHQRYGDDVVIDTRPADAVKDVGVPVKFENPDWVSPFTGLMGIFAPPKYGSFDPSWTLAVFFPLFFGLVVGDIGFGLVFAVIAYFLGRRGKAGKDLDTGPLNILITPGGLKAISAVMYWCAAWSIVFGFLFGEFFGNLLERLPAGKPIFYTTLHHEAGYGFINIPLFRVEVFTPLLLLSIGFGVLQVVGGWVIRAIYAAKHGDTKHLYEGIGMIAGLLALVVFAAAFMMNALTTPVMVIAALGFVVFLVCTFLAGIPLMLVELISNAGNVLSYLRLFAVGLSAALVANLVTSLGFGIAGTLPVLGPILGILVALIVHALAMALTIIGHALQPLRLQYVEFFTKFGFYDSGGRPYKPFKLIGGK